MSENEKPVPLTHADRRARVLKLRQERVESEEARERADTALAVAEWAEIAQRAVASFAELPCEGMVVNVGRCSDEYANGCRQQGSPSCPRNIQAFDQKQRQDEEDRRVQIYSGIPDDVLDDLYAPTFRPTPATQAIDRWLTDTKNKLLLLSGLTGTGKSVASAYAIQRSPGRWMRASDIEETSQFEHKHERVTKLDMAQLVRARLLVVDEISDEGAGTSAWARGKLADLVLRRYEQGLRTLMTTNMDAERWKKWADDRLQDRLRTGTVWAIPGKSMRGRRL